jgi:hypothetical protein
MNLESDLLGWNLESLLEPRLRGRHMYASKCFRDSYPDLEEYCLHVAWLGCKGWRPFLETIGLSDGQWKYGVRGKNGSA